MNWRDALHKDIRFLSGSKRDRKPRRGSTRSRSWAPRYFRKGRYWKDLLTVTGILQGLVRANAPLVGGLQMAAHDAPRYPLWRVLTGLEQDLALGMPLSESAAGNRRFFPGFYSDLLKSGEASGTLLHSFDLLREILVEIINRRTRIAQYRAYIGMIWVFLLAVFAFLSVKVQPVFREVLKDFGEKIPPAMQFLVDLGDFLAYRWWALLLLFNAAIIAGCFLLKIRFLNNALGWLLLYTPGLGGLLRKSALAHVALVLEKLLAAGMPIDAALDAAAGLDVHPLFAAALQRVRKRVQGGATLKDSFSKERCFPRSFRGFVSVGESSNLLPNALAQAGDLYRRQVAKVTRILLDLLSPLGVIAAGAGALLLFASYLEFLAATCAALVDKL
ncbi:MAG: type II secretion system F family protein [Candidatus Hydrogenedentes bacterium]|nr:type II secretion system F family protein [Candidatus Hydrogenedentota bacterium]